MRLVLDAEQQQLRSSVRKLLADHAPPARVRAVMDGEDGCDRELWRRITDQLGLAGLVVPEEHGGAGAGHVERAIVLEELGRTLAPVPFFASAVLATDTALALGDSELLPRLASGEVIGALAVSKTWGPLDVRATEHDGGWTLDGQAPFVISGDIADTVYVHNGDWFAVSEGFTRTTLHTLDPTRRIARLDFAGTPARRLSASDGALARVRDLAAVALAAEQVGGMGRVLETTADYAKVRVQFGRAIGSYQGVKHRLADMYSAYERAESLLRHAAWSADHDAEGLPLAAATTQAFVGPACFQAAADGVQLHGGIGYTWEHHAHLYYKRAKTSELLFAGGRGDLARRLGLEPT
ncbi:acyl-CoA/acyl-ACP dehydrogenase [Amycolatopsis acidiphila]|uniref:Acyl-CoA dehydrogenase n=1 Tax=Amycolatopsis acidiphila TaxID=715473 RepID=A0A558A706_9PSEU|nr:acyl-CoA dehydrogenase family protein [Amycolatopsis acidiphila]TVT20032.1 acyl-CoA dehydrogenase [Amycolatopsis acidiphila]UIJ63496.1 acyl-CoA/acyl-ACP dehydrogenase [Amycolatopsis acidiphila]GHG68590.1 acyl-CoA dehydrogenase [Amycolatopsis acidiphila]